MKIVITGGAGFVGSTLGFSSSFKILREIGIILFTKI